MNNVKHEKNQEIDFHSVEIITTDVFGHCEIKSLCRGKREKVMESHGILKAQEYEAF